MISYIQPIIVKLGPIGEPFNPRLTRLEPPSGSAVDQDTTHVSADAAMVIAGGIDGDPAKEHYLTQRLYNNRSPTTGFGCVIGYVGAVTEPLLVALCSTQIDPNNPGDDTCEVGVSIDPSELEPGNYYYLEVTFAANPVDFPTNTPLYMLMATNQNYDTQNNIGWVWAGSSENPYDRGKIMVFQGSASGWQDFFGGVYDGLFTTYTEGEPVPCSSHTTQSACVNAGCYWYDNSCHTDPPQTECETYTTKTTCEAAYCYWWSNGTCHNTPESTTDCEQHMTQSACESANCYWYPYPNPFG